MGSAKNRTESSLVLEKKGKRTRMHSTSKTGDSLGRMLALLNLFTPAAPAWSANELIRFMRISRSTGYRHIKALSSIGLLAAGANGYYILGPRIIELDRQIRQCDPIYNAAGGIMKRLVSDTGHSSLLCVLFSDSVMCIREELTRDSPANLFTRGQRRPLFFGAASKIILPYLTPHQLKTLFERNRKAIAKAGLGADWPSFRMALATIRRVGYVMTTGEFNPGVVGLSAPIFNSARRIIGSLGIAAAEVRFRRSRIPSTAQMVMRAANEVSKALMKGGAGLDRSPRAVGSAKQSVAEQTPNWLAKSRMAG